MGVTKIGDPDPREDSPPATLGDIVLASAKAVPETEWVALVRSIAERDLRALHGVYERTHRIVFTLILAITKDPERAEELTVEVFRDVWQRASEYDPGYGSVVGWVMNLARSRAIRAKASGGEQGSGEDLPDEHGRRPGSEVDR